MRVTIPQIIEALRAEGGRPIAAATRLGISPQNLDGRLARSSRLRAERLLIQRRNLEVAEGNILRDVFAGDPTASRFLLDRKGKDAGWSRRTELGGPDNQPLNINFGLDKIDPETLAEYFRRAGPPPGSEEDL